MKTEELKERLNGYGFDVTVEMWLDYMGDGTDVYVYFNEILDEYDKPFRALFQEPDTVDEAVKKCFSLLRRRAS